MEEALTENLAVEESRFVFLSMGCLLLLMAAHIFAGKLRFLDVIPRSKWLSLSSGVSIAYIFLHLLPELSHGEHIVQTHAPAVLKLFSGHVFFLSLVGFTLFYGLERYVGRERKLNLALTKKNRATEEAFWVHMASFTLYNLIIGYLLIQRKPDEGLPLFTFTVAMALHFVVNDYGLRSHHREMYTHLGRWILSFAVFVGWVLGLLFEIHEIIIIIMIALLSGGAILNVIKEELPEERESHFPSFLCGVLIYSLILLFR